MRVEGHKAAQLAVALAAAARRFATLEPRALNP